MAVNHQLRSWERGGWGDLHGKEMFDNKEIPLKVLAIILWFLSHCCESHLPKLQRDRVELLRFGNSPDNQQ